MNPLLLDHFRNFGRNKATVLLMGLGLAACGQVNEDSQPQSIAPLAATISFSQWCTQWGLECSGDTGSIDAPTPAEWKALNTVISSYMTSASSFSLTSAELGDANLKQTLKTLRLDDLLDRLQTRTQEAQWQSLSLVSGSAVSKAGLEVSDTASSGLTYHWGTQEQTRWDDKGNVFFSGLSLSGKTSKDKVGLQSVAMMDDGTMTLGLSTQTVTGVPFKSIVNSLLDSTGIDLQMIKDKNIQGKEFAQAVSPLMAWLNKPSRVISLNESFFRTLSAQLPALVTKDETGTSLSVLASTLTSLKTAAGSTGNVATVNSGAAVKCDWDNGEFKVTLAKEYGLKRSYQVNDTTSGLEFYGVQVSGRKSLGLTITLKRVELDKDKITILDVPVTGKVDLKWSELTSSENAKLICTKS